MVEGVEEVPSCRNIDIRHYGECVVTAVTRDLELVNNLSKKLIKFKHGIKIMTDTVVGPQLIFVTNISTILVFLVSF